MREKVLIKASVDVLKLYSIGKDKNKKSCKFLESFEHEQDRRKRTIFGCRNALQKIGFVSTFSCMRERIAEKVVCPFACLIK